MSDPGLLGGSKDEMSITADWSPSSRQLIDGVHVIEVKNVMTAHGHLTEIYRDDWGLEPGHVGQVFQSMLAPGSITAWHAHAVTTDRLFAQTGTVFVALYDARPDSSTNGLVNTFRIGALRPTLLVVPPRVWHGVKNVSGDGALLLNIVDHPYQYEDPDHYRLDVDSEKIPFDIISAT